MNSRAGACRLYSDRNTLRDCRPVSAKGKASLTTTEYPPMVGLAADTTELMYAGIGADVGAVCDEHVAGQGGGVGHDYVVANQTVMRHMRLGHEETIVADSGNPTAAGSSR